MTVSNVYQYMDVLSTEEFRQAFAEHANAPETFKLGNADVDWQKEIYRVALGTDHNLSMTGALKNMPYRVSVGYTNQNGTLKNNNYERINASVGLSPKFFDKHLSDTKDRPPSTSTCYPGMAAIRKIPKGAGLCWSGRRFAQYLLGNAGSIGKILYELKKFGGWFGDENFLISFR